MGELKRDIKGKKNTSHQWMTHNKKIDMKQECN